MGERCSCTGCSRKATAIHVGGKAVRGEIRDVKYPRCDAHPLPGAHEIRPMPKEVEVITHEGETMIVDPKAMTVGRPYETIFGGVPLVIIKRDSGEVDFYYVDTIEEAEDHE